MKTKERTIQKSTKSTKQNNRAPISETNVDYDEVKKKLNQGNMLVAEPIRKTTKKGPSKTQINRLKQFYNTTRWLPNSAFTTYFGKPAFENYGYGNTNPVYGGLFYGNYMLSHNMNPIDGANHPEEKQVYSSAMMKSVQRKGVRRPSPPRKVPEEIRNTPEELQEIRTRKQIFQLPNNFPSRDIIPPNLLKARYFRSGKNTPENSEDENEDEYEDWNIENVLSGKNKMKTYEKENYSTIQPKPSYRSPIVRNKTLRNKDSSNIKEKNFLEQSELINNRIEKSFTKSIPVNNLQNKIQTARESTKIIEQKEPKETKPKNKMKKHLSSYDLFVPKNQKNNLPSSHHFTFNDMKKKKRQSSIESNKAQLKEKKSKDNLKYVCDNCYNNKIATRKYKEIPIEQKEILNNTFNKENISQNYFPFIIKNLKEKEAIKIK